MALDEPFGFWFIIFGIIYQNLVLDCLGRRGPMKLRIEVASGKSSGAWPGRLDSVGMQVFPGIFLLPDTIHGRIGPDKEISLRNGDRSAAQVF